MNDAQTSPAILEDAKSLLQNSRIADAEALLQPYVLEHDESSEAHYLLAVCQRYLKQSNNALKTLQRLKVVQPAYGRAYQEEGHVHIALGDSAAALQAYRHAVSLNNSLLASWQAIAGLLTDQNDSELKTEAARQVEKLSALPPELLSVRNMTAERRYFQAEELCRRFLKVNPKFVEGMRLLADLGVKSDVLDDAEFILESAVEFEPNNVFARHDYMTVLYRRQKYEESLQQAKLLVEGDPENLDFHISLANQLVAVGDYDAALKIYDDAIAQRPHSAELHLVHGHALKTIGDVEPAVAAYRHAYRSRPNFGDAFWSLANLKTYRFTDAEVGAMHDSEKNSATVIEDRAHLCFALGKHFEDTRKFADSARY
ncbi:MAG: tetratricopeptide repeat protein, partial [Woeseia sp.]|nr:tetratricopeptide repeat protein [Woeseia sp.]